MDRTPLGRLARMYKAFSKNYKNLDKLDESTDAKDVSDGAPIYHSDQELVDKDWDCKYMFVRARLVSVVCQHLMPLHRESS